MATIPASENVFPEVLLAEVAAPAAAPSGQVRLYVKADGLLYWKDDAGVEYAVGQGDTTAHLADAAGAHAASAVSIDPTGLSVVTGTELQTAIEELDAGAGAFNPDTMLPWHAWIIPMITTPDAVTGTWVQNGSTTAALDFPFYTPGSTANSGGAGNLFNSSSAQNDAIAYDVILAAGTWDFHAWVRKSTNTGIITLQQDGADQGTADTYAAAAAAAKVSITGFTVATTGKHRMNVKMATKNASSSNYILQMFAVEFRRTA